MPLETPVDHSRVGHTFDEISLDGTIKRRWLFEACTRDGFIYTIPFRYWTLSRLDAEMRTAIVTFGIGGVLNTASVRVNVAHSTLMLSSATGVHGRLYAYEEGSILVVLHSPQSKLASELIHFWISIHDSITEIPKHLTRQIFAEACRKT